MGVWQTNRGINKLVDINIKWVNECVQINIQGSNREMDGWINGCRQIDGTIDRFVDRTLGGHV